MSARAESSKAVSHAAARQLERVPRPLARRGARALGFAFLALAACAPYRSSAPPPPTSAPAPVRVRLAAAERLEELRIETARGPLTLRRVGTAVEASDGRRGADIPIEGGGRLSLEMLGRSYPGRLVVEAHPQFGLRVVNEVELEEYVQGVVASEISLWSAAPAELEAQAIAARTYAAAALAAGQPLYDDTRDQAYRGRFEPLGGSRDARLSAKLEAAVRATRDEVLLEPDGRLMDVRYHAACGGRTADSERGPGVVCDACEARAQTERLAGRPDPERPLAWHHRLDRAELGRLARELDVGTKLRSIGPVRVDAAGRWLEIEAVGDLGRRRLPFDRLRHLIGPAELKSAMILRTVPREGERIRDELLFEGLGRGHGMGLCQEGAHDAALAGWSARRILEHYYPGARLGRASHSFSFGRLR